MTTPSSAFETAVGEIRQAVNDYPVSTIPQTLTRILDACDTLIAARDAEIAMTTAFETAVDDFAFVEGTFSIAEATDRDTTPFEKLRAAKRAALIAAHNAEIVERDARIKELENQLRALMDGYGEPGGLP